MGDHNPRSTIRNATELKSGGHQSRARKLHRATSGLLAALPIRRRQQGRYGNETVHTDRSIVPALDPDRRPGYVA
jgi:hypothetical protein